MINRTELGGCERGKGGKRGMTDVVPQSREPMNWPCLREVDIIEEKRG